MLPRLSLEDTQPRSPFCQYQGAGSLPTPFSSGRGSLCASVCVSINLVSLNLSDLCCLCLHFVYLCTALFLPFLFVPLVLCITPFSLFPTPRPSPHLQQFEVITSRKGSLRAFWTSKSGELRDVRGVWENQEGQAGLWRTLESFYWSQSWSVVSGTFFLKLL